MKTIPITRFIPPHGTTKIERIEIEDKYFQKYQQMDEAGCFITLEQPTNGFISICIDNGEMDIDCRITFNQTEIVPTIQKMLHNFSIEKLETRRKEFEDDWEYDDDDDDDDDDDVHPFLK